MARPSSFPPRSVVRIDLGTDVMIGDLDALTGCAEAVDPVAVAVVNERWPFTIEVAVGRKEVLDLFLGDLQLR